jgi:epoxide hydrolase-like predicted phosphatase
MTSNLFDSFRAFSESEGLSLETVGEHFRNDPASRELLIALETGKLSEDEFEPKFAAVLGVHPDGLIDRLFAGGRPDEAMQEAVRRSRQAGIRTGLLSNSWGTRRYPRELLSELFDGVVISGEVGIRKPDAEIYQLAAREIAVEPSACVFVDDLPFNLRPAEELGMAVVHHVDPIETIGELEELFGVVLR